MTNTIEDIIRDRSKAFFENAKEGDKGRFVTDIILDKNGNPATTVDDWHYIMTVDLRTLGMPRSKLLES